MIRDAMLYTILAGLPIVAATILGAAYLRRHGRAERGVWLLGLVLAFLVPVAMMGRGPAVSTFEAPAPFVDAGSVTAAPSASPGSSLALSTPQVPSVDVDAVLLAVWLAVSLGLAARWLVSAIRLELLRRKWTRTKLHDSNVYLTTNLGPAVAGTLRPRILVPSWVTDLAEGQRRLVLLHEREHVRAGDHLLLATCRLARIIAPWNPAVWALTSGLTRALELDCDRRVLRRHPDVAAYGATLLAISERASVRALAAAAFAESHVSLRRRILAMTTPARRMRAAGAVAAAGVVLTLLAGAASVPVPAIPLGILAAQVRGAIALPQGTADVLPPIRITADPEVRLMGFLLPSGESAIRQVGPVGRWFPLSGDGRTGIIVAPESPRATWGFVGPWADPTQVRQLVEVPQLLNGDEVLAAIEAEYPPRLRELGIGGTVGVKFLVEAAGVVVHRRVSQPSAYRELDDAALRVARIYRFAGGAAENIQVPIWVTHAIDFRVD